MSRRSQGDAGNHQGKAATNCWYYGRKGYKESERWKKRADSERSGSSLGDADRHHKSHFTEGLGRAKTGPALVMKHKTNHMGVCTSKPEEVWYVDFGASNHMTNHTEWFSSLEKLEQSRVVETGNNTQHPIKHVGDIPLNHVSQKGVMRNVLHVLTIAKNLVFVRQIVVQGMHVRFNHHNYFIEYEGMLIVHGCRDRRMFILKANDVGTAMFAKGQKVKCDIDLWHKQIGHINFPKLQELC